MKIKNWGWNCENETAKGYVMLAVKEWNIENPEEQISTETLNNILSALSSVFSNKTAEEAYKYYCEN